MITCTIDSRETKLIQLGKQESTFSFLTKALDIGDIYFQDEEYELVIERKTWDDFRSSVRDSRFREQRSRLREWKCTPTRQVMYMIEGRYESDYEMEMKTCERLMIGYSIPVLFFPSMESLFRKLVQWYKFGSLEGLFQTRSIETDQIESRIQQTKKRNYDDPSLFFMGLLCQMKGVSSSMATTIVTKYTTILLFSEKLREDPIQTVHDLEQLEYSTGTKRKKIPKTIVKRLLQNLGQTV